MSEFRCPACKATMEVTTTLPPHPSRDTNGLCAMSGLLPATVTLMTKGVAN